MLQKELRPLEAFRQLLADRLLNYPRAGKSNQSARLSQYNVAQHCKAGGDASCRRIGQDAHIELAGLVMSLEGCGGLCHLHQGNKPFLHSGPAGRSKYDNRQSLTGCTLHGSCNLLSHIMPHAAHQEPGITDCNYRILSVDFAAACHNRLIHA